MVMQEFTLQKVSLIIMWLSISLPGKATSAKQKKKNNLHLTVSISVLISVRQGIQKVMAAGISCLF